MKTQKKKVTLETLSAQIGGLDNRVGALDAKIGGLDKRVGGLDTKIGALDKRVGGLDAKIGGLDTKIEDRFDEFARMTNVSFQSVEDHITALSERTDDVEKAIMAIHGVTDAIFSEIRLIREEIHGVDTREDVAALEDRVTMLEKKTGLKATTKIKRRAMNQPNGI